jgi:hypothetical protein
MRRWIAGLLVLGLVSFLVAGPTSAEAGGRRHGHGGRHHGRHIHRGAPLVGALALGAASGLIIGSIFAPKVYAAPAPEPVYVAPAPVYVPPAPVYVAPPPPVCSSYWVNTYWNGGGWVPGHWEQVCR